MDSILFSSCLLTLHFQTFPHIQTCLYIRISSIFRGIVTGSIFHKITGIFPLARTPRHD